jgi:hypothetical protein
MENLNFTKTTIVCFFFGTLLMVPISVFSQENKVEKILEKIEEKDFKKAIELNDKLKEETPVVLKNFVNLVLYNDFDYSERNVDSAYNYLRIVSRELQTIDYTIKNEYCIRFYLCESTLKENKIKLESEAFLLYSKDSSIVSLRYFTTHFDNNELIQKAENLIERIEYNNAVKINTIDGFKQFLVKYPTSIFKAESINYLSNLEYKLCLEKESEDCYRDYLKLYPISKSAIQVAKRLKSLVYNNAISLNTVEKYEQFLSEYASDNDESFNSEVKDIKDRLCYLNFLKIKNSLSKDSIQLFITNFESCKYVDSAKFLLERSDFNYLQNNFTIATANYFIIKYPASTHKKEILLKLFDLELPILLNMENNDEINSYIKKYEELDVAEKLSKIGFPMIYTDNTNWKRKFGYISPVDSNILIYPMYEEVRDFSNGLAAVKFNNLWGFVDKTGKVIIEILYEEVKDFHEGLAGVKQNGLWQVINKSNTPISNQKYQNVGSYNSGLINVSALTSGWVFISQKGEIKSKGASYLAASQFSSGYAFVQEGSEFFIIDTMFNKIAKVDYEQPLYNNYTIYDACSGFEASPERYILCKYYERRVPYSLIKYGDALLLNDGLVYDIKKKECWISEYIYFDDQILVYGNRRTQRSQQAMLYIYSNKSAVQSFNINQNEYGNSSDIKIDRNKNLVVLEYSSGKKSNVRIQSMDEVRENKYKLITDNQGYHFEDKNKSILGNKLDYSFASEFVNERAIVGVSNKYILIDVYAKQIGGVYDQLIRVNSNKFVGWLSGKCFLLDNNGNCISKGYDYVDTKVYDGTIIVSLNTLYGFIDIEGIEIIRPQFSEVHGFSSGKAIVTVLYTNTNCFGWDCKGTRVIDKKGNKLIGDFKKVLEYNPKMKF